MTKYDMSREEAVGYMSKQVQDCDDCSNGSVCGYHKAEITEAQYQFDAQIGPEIVKNSNNGDAE